MDTVTALFGWIGRTLRWVFDLASMAVGVAPTSIALAEAATASSADGLPRRSGWAEAEDPEEFSTIFRREVGLDPF